MKRTLITIIVTASLLLTPTLAKADALQACNERVTACEKALDTTYTALSHERDYSEALEGNNKYLAESLRQANAALDEKDKWYHDPLTIGGITFSLGVLVTALLIHGR